MIDRICYDRILPQDLHRLATAPTGAQRLAIWASKRWPNGAKLRVRFIGGNSAQTALVRMKAAEWSQYANITFEYVPLGESDIRISFNERDGAWSYIGTDCKYIPQDQPTMNLGWQGGGVELHEFGHGALGLVHEHESPAGGINWNKPVVNASLGGPPNYWSQAMIDANMYTKYSANQVNASALDPTSIMMYHIPPEWTLDGWSAPWNSVLSPLDKEFIGSERGYPKDGEGSVELVVGGAEVFAEVTRAGEVDAYTFRVDAPGRYVVETSGRTDTYMSLFGPDLPTSLIAGDDDSGVGFNARITRRLLAGVYFVQVRHYRPERTGAYGVRAYGVRVGVRV